MVVLTDFHTFLKTNYTGVFIGIGIFLMGLIIFIAATLIRGIKRKISRRENRAPSIDNPGYQAGVEDPIESQVPSGSSNNRSTEGDSRKIERDWKNSSVTVYVNEGFGKNKGKKKKKQKTNVSNSNDSVRSQDYENENVVEELKRPTKGKGIKGAKETKKKKSKVTQSNSTESDHDYENEIEKYGKKTMTSSQANILQSEEPPAQEKPKKNKKGPKNMEKKKKQTDKDRKKDGSSGQESQEDSDNLPDYENC